MKPYKELIEFIDRTLNDETLAIGYDKNTVRCADCGELFQLEDEDGVASDYIYQDGEYICEDCKQDHWEKCEDCGEWFNRDVEGTYMESLDRTVCDRCLDDYYQCSNCGEWVHEDDAYYSEITGEYYCETCYSESFTRCDNCDREIYRDDACYDDYGNCYCEECYQDDTIYSYHDFDDWETRYGKDESYRDELPTFGIELEVGGDTSYARGFLDSVDDRDLVLMSDSSVDGFEIITMPMTRKYYTENFVKHFTKGLNYLKDHGFKGEDEGGMHVHFTEIENPYQLVRLVKIMYGDFDARQTWLTLTNRTQEKLDRWASMSNRRTTVEEFLDGVRYVSGCEGDHGTALNYDERTGTHEFRIFNSSLDIDKITMNMEIVWSLLDYTAQGGTNLNVDTGSYLKWVVNYADEYPRLVQFIKDNELLNLYEVDDIQALAQDLASDVQLKLNLDFDLHPDNLFEESDETAGVA